MGNIFKDEGKQNCNETHAQFQKFLELLSMAKNLMKDEDVGLTFVMHATFLLEIFHFHKKSILTL
jgi:hypothetical protein